MSISLDAVTAFVVAKQAARSPQPDWGDRNPRGSRSVAETADAPVSRADPHTERVGCANGKPSLETCVWMGRGRSGCPPGGRCVNELPHQGSFCFAITHAPPLGEKRKGKQNPDHLHISAFDFKF